MSITGHYVEVHGTSTYYETNDPAKTQIVCLHTAGRENRQWHGMMACLAGKFQLIALDMPGHGKTYPLKGNRCIDNRDDYAAFIWDFAQALGLPNPIMMGCSLGGNLVLQLAQVYPVKAIVCMQGSDYTPSISPTALAMMTHPYVSMQHSHLDFTESLIGGNPDPGAKDFLMWCVAQSVPVAHQKDLSIYTSFDLRQTMPKITCPVLMIRGEDDWLVSQDLTDGTRSRLMNAAKLVYERLEGVGHFPHVEKPKAISAMVENFLNQL
jgi:pimeloyl-ACP methyl ester carboxylesterase